MKLRNKAAIVTGSSKGIGAEIAKELAKEGCSVVINFIKDKDGAEEIRDYIKNQFDKEALTVKADISNFDEVKMMINKTVEHFGKIDILVNNAAIVTRAPFLEVTEKDWDENINTNLKGVFITSQTASKEMIKSGGGSIVNISSIAALRSMDSLAPYCASKGGVTSLTASMAMELSKYGIKVNAIAPGPIDVERNRKTISNFPECLTPYIPMKRIGEVEDISKLAVFLCSKDSDYITGQTISVCGGLIDYVPPLE